MTLVRRRRRMRYVRFAARVAPVLAIASAGAGVALGGVWAWAGAGTAALLSLGLAVIVLRLERRWRVDTTGVRAALAVEYAAEHARDADEHRSFTSHMVGLLDSASSRIAMLRRRIDSLELEIATMRFARTTAAPPAAELARLSENTDWTELWPDLADAPTVVDMVAWDERAQRIA